MGTTKEGHKGIKLVLWYALSTLSIALVAFLSGNNLNFASWWDAVRFGALCSIFVAIVVHVFDWHEGIDYAIKAVYIPPLYLLMLGYTILGYIYDIVRKTFDRKYIIVPRSLGWGKDAEHKRLEYLRAKKLRMYTEAEALDSEHDYIMAVGRRRHIEVDLERQRLEQEHELEMVRYQQLHGDEPTEEELKVEMLREQLTHQRRVNQRELETLDRSGGSSRRQIHNPKDDDDDVVF